MPNYSGSSPDTEWLRQTDFLCKISAKYSWTLKRRCLLMCLQTGRQSVLPPMFSIFFLSAPTQRSLLWMRLQVFKPRALCPNAPKCYSPGPQGVQFWEETKVVRKIGTFYNFVSHFCSQVPEVTLLMPRVSQSHKHSYFSHCLPASCIHHSCLPTCAPIIHPCRNKQQFMYSAFSVYT